MQYWDRKNPHWIREIDYQHRCFFNVWYVKIGHQIIGPYFINGSLTGWRYFTFLSETLKNLLKEVPLQNICQCSINMTAALHIMSNNHDKY